MTSADATKRRRKLIALKKKHDLSNAQIALLAGGSVKAVESWLAKPGAAAYRPIPACRLELILIKAEGKQHETDG